MGQNMPFAHGPIKVLMIAGTGALPLEVLFCLKDAGATVHVASFSGSPLRHSRRIEALHDLPLSVASRDPDTYVAKINELQRIERYDCIVPGSGADVLCDLQDRIDIPSFPVPSIEGYRVLNDKWRFTQLCSANGIPVPESECVTDKVALRNRYGQRDQRLVVKPTSEGFMAGVVFPASAEELRRQVLDNAAYTYSPLIVQEYIDGVDIDLSVLAWNGRIVKAAAQLRERGEIVFVDNLAFMEYAERIVAATNYSGVAHFDARISAADGTLYLLECNPRFWGSIAAALYCGVNFVEEGMKLALDMPVSEGKILPGCRYSSPSNAVRRAGQLDFTAFRGDRHVSGGLVQVFTDPVPYFMVNMARHADQALRDVT
jgi:biotin carboxylase